MIQAYEDTYLPQVQVAQKIFGAMAFNGQLPVSSPPGFKIGEGLLTNAEGKLEFTLPEDAGINSDQCTKIDSLVEHAIIDTLFPGCQVLVALKSKVIYNKSF